MIERAEHQTYPEYRKTGIVWLGEIPKHWDVYPLFALASENKQRNTDGQENNVLSLSYGRIIRRDVSTNFGLLPESFDTYQRVSPGDIVLRLTDLQNDQKSLRVGLVGEPGVVTSAYVGLKLRQIDPHFCYYLLHNYDLAKVFYALGGGVRQSMKYDDLKHLPLLFPPIEEQHAIADFLDRETARIDVLIARKQRLLELLAERRQALITHAVTKGLNPDAPMQDSGIEWLGDVPTSWQITKLKRLGRIGNGSTPLRDNEDYWKDGTFPWLTSTVVNEDVVGEATQFVTETALRECHLPIVDPNSVLIAITGQGKTRGMATLLRYQATINQHLVYVSPSFGKVNAEFLQRHLSSAYEILRLLSEGAGSTRGALTIEQIADFPVAVPPIAEQNRILMYLSDKTRQLDLLSQSITKVVSRLQERRAALIDEAVTGKMKVTG